MRFLIDAQLPVGLARWLTQQQHDAAHVSDLGMQGAEDAAIWARAIADDAHLITKDEDFVALRQSLTAGPSVIWLRIGNTTNRALLAWIVGVWPTVLVALQASETVIEVQ